MKSGGTGVIEGKDGNSLYYSRDGAIWKGHLSGRNATRLIETMDFQNWRLCGNEVCVVQRRTRETGELICYDPATRRQQSRPLAIGRPYAASHGVDISPDGRWIIYTRADSIQDDVMMVENFH